jgi:hypothetical protein
MRTAIGLRFDPFSVLFPLFWKQVIELTADYFQSRFSDLECHSTSLVFVMFGHKRQKLRDIDSKLEKLEERLINDDIDPSMYKKWRTKLQAEKENLETEIHRLSDKNRNLFERLSAAIPALTNLKKLYHTINLNGKQTLLKRVFEVAPTNNGIQLRTPRLNSALIHNYQKITEKRLLFLEQPEEILMI